MMSLTSIDPELWRMVMAKYPKIERERTCRMEKDLRDMARMAYLKKLYEGSGTADLLADGDADAAQAASQVHRADQGAAG
jgi:hypothetical protein